MSHHPFVRDVDDILEENAALREMLDEIKALRDRYLERKPETSGLLNELAALLETSA